MRQVTEDNSIAALLLHPQNNNLIYDTVLFD